MSYAEKLKQERLSRKLTLSDLGSLVGRSKQYMFLLENGKIRLSYEMAVKIAKVLGMTPDCLFLQ